MTFPKTATALVQYDATAADRVALWDSINSNQDAVACQSFDLAAERMVQMAFYQDTKHYNSMENCMRVSAKDIKAMVSKA